jgi:acyl carrier protein
MRAPAPGHGATVFEIEGEAVTDQEILAGLAEIIDEIAGVPADEVTPEKNFVEDLDIDSLSMVEIAVAAQDKFGVEIPDEQLKDLKTVHDVVNFVSKNVSKDS